jgi:hypothetical protein
VSGRRGSTARSTRRRHADDGTQRSGARRSVAELVGGELYASLQAQRGLRFEWWFSELVDATVERVEEGDDTGREGAVWLLHGLAAQHGHLPAEVARPRAERGAGPAHRPARVVGRHVPPRGDR